MWCFLTLLSLYSNVEADLLRENQRVFVSPVFEALSPLFVLLFNPGPKELRETEQRGKEDKDRECPECHYEFSFGSESNFKSADRR